ncbi:MAG: DegT/DnrJ/EryC1/StrS family aminotransferase [Candidatus Sericytochromatia bacterium]|nr:DegT/DnrJ/EryC1/StrS family aminotransferase [Candidatus Sericytochromatia bacterium]
MSDAPSSAAARVPLIGGPPEIRTDPPPRSVLAGENFLRQLGLHLDPVALTGSAREAAAWWERHLAPPGAILVPAYGCRSIIQPYLQACRGIRFYPVGKDLVPDREALMTLKRGAGSLHVVHYFGFPAPDWLYGLGLPVIEDAVQGLLDPRLWSRGRWALGSFRKFGPTSAGGFLLDRVDIPPLPAAPDEVLRRWERLGQWRRDKHRAAESGDVAGWLDAMARLAADESAMDDSPIRPVALSGEPLARLQDFKVQDMRAGRRAGWRAYQDALADQPDIVQVLPELPPGVVPYGFPILTEARDELKAHLLQQGIQSTVHWDVPEEVPAASFPDSYWLASRILTLPLGGPTPEEDARKVAETLLVWTRQKKG